MKSSNIEQEVKFLVEGFETIETVLRKLGADITQPRTYEINYRFDTEDRSLEKEKKILRLRQDMESRLTFKGPGEIRDGLHSRLEVEINVDSIDKTRTFLEALGYQVCMVYEKYRTTYQLDGVEIMLDEMPYGNFIELEGDNPGKIQDIAMHFNLDWDERVLVSYGELFDLLKKNLDLTIRDLTFENFRGMIVTPADFQER